MKNKEFTRKLTMMNKKQIYINWLYKDISLVYDFFFFYSIYEFPFLSTLLCVLFVFYETNKTINAINFKGEIDWWNYNNNRNIFIFLTNCSWLECRSSFIFDNFTRKYFNIESCMDFWIERYCCQNRGNMELSFGFFFFFRITKLSA